MVHSVREQKFRGAIAAGVLVAAFCLNELSTRENAFCERTAKFAMAECHRQVAAATAPQKLRLHTLVDAPA